MDVEYEASTARRKHREKPTNEPGFPSRADEPYPAYARQAASTVHGQDHVVPHSPRAMFAAEVLPHRTRSASGRAPYSCLRGPPGVGKTFLAEQARSTRYSLQALRYVELYCPSVILSLIGFEKSYQGAKPGTLTGFVKEQPHSILLFDVIEKERT